MNNKYFNLTACLFSIFCFFFHSASFSQYYYNDILQNALSNKNYVAMSNAKVKQITVTHYDNNNILQNDLKIEQTFNKEWTLLDSKTITSDNVRPLSLLNYYKDNHLVKTEDTYDSVQTSTTYNYNNKGLLESVSSFTNDTTIASESLESHQWVYNETGRLLYMLKVKNRHDTTKIELIYDKDSLITEENWVKKSKVIETY